MLVCKDLSVRREGLADGVAAAMDRPRSDPFTANPSVFLCTEYAPTVASCSFLIIRYSSKYGTFENSIICGAKISFCWPDLNQRPQCYIIHTLQIFIAGIWLILGTKQTVRTENEFLFSWRLYRLITAIEMAQPFVSRAALQGTCMCTYGLCTEGEEETSAGHV